MSILRRYRGCFRQSLFAAACKSQQQSEQDEDDFTHKKPLLVQKFPSCSYYTTNTHRFSTAYKCCLIIRVMIPTATPRSSSMCVTAKKHRPSCRVCAGRGRCGQWRWLRYSGGHTPRPYAHLSPCRHICFAPDTASDRCGWCSRIRFYICTDGKLLQAITVDLQNTDEDLIPDRKAVIGIPDPIPGQVPCHD